jgi:hypothetical protein
MTFKVDVKELKFLKHAHLKLLFTSKYFFDRPQKSELNLQFLYFKILTILKID